MRPCNVPSNESGSDARGASLSFPFSVWSFREKKIVCTVKNDIRTLLFSILLDICMTYARIHDSQKMRVEREKYHILFL